MQEYSYLLIRWKTIHTCFNFKKGCVVCVHFVIHKTMLSSVTSCILGGMLNFL